MIVLRKATGKKMKTCGYLAGAAIRLSELMTVAIFNFI